MPIANCERQAQFEHADEGPGLAYIVAQMQGDLIKYRSFKIVATGEHKDRSATGKLMWSSTSHSQVLVTAEHFDFSGGHRRHPQKGELIQQTVTDFLSMCKEIASWPGDGPNVSAKAMFLAHARLLGKLTGVENEDIVEMRPEDVDDDGRWRQADGAPAPA